MMAATLTRCLLFCSFLLSFIVLSFANYEYQSTDQRLYYDVDDQHVNEQRLTSYHDQGLPVTRDHQEYHHADDPDHNKRNYGQNQHQSSQGHNQVLHTVPTDHPEYVYENSKLEGNEKFVSVKSEYDPSELLKTNIDDQVHEGLVPTNKFIAIQGLILCKSGFTYLPLEGAKARIICKATKDDNNLHDDKTSPYFSILTDVTDSNGLFLETFSHSYVDQVKLKLSECKLFLGASPLESCKIPTDVNYGISGAQLSSVRILKDKILYIVGPFIYTSLSEYKPASGHY
ncbi:hypothetical protein PanWU01x14_296610 [Parasponia andersonii]|uniref:Pollen Ole e 1 allergen and extensin family protein n=1 Tax=Parasponia andersonii TaxID=3476 RepID=A0A2P5AVH7_PARAD|nr:hypothetical protein PanWU01x14_296610 [Parasponia andersonii]